MPKEKITKQMVDSAVEAYCKYEDKKNQLLLLGKRAKAVKTLPEMAVWFFVLEDANHHDIGQTLEIRSRQFGDIFEYRNEFEKHYKGLPWDSFGQHPPH